MSATINWIIEWMQCKPTEGQYTDVVIVAGWRCNGFQAAGVPAVQYSASNYGTVSFPVPEGQFTPYAELTQQQVLQWCWAGGVNKDETEASIQSQLDEQISPQVVQLPLPWAITP